MLHRLVAPIALLVSTLLTTGCFSSRPAHIRTNALEYLYPSGKSEATEPLDVTLQVPVRVGVAFAPGALGSNDPFSAVQKQALLERVAQAFREEEFVGRLEVVPATYLTAGGSFPELERLQSALGVDLMVLVSYDQRQFSETTNAAWTYLTVIGAYVVQGEKNETRTLVDAVVYDIRSRSLLFRAPGESSLAGASTPVKVDRELRQEGERGLELATDDLIENLRTGLAEFREQIKTGTVRGPGTPAIQIVDSSTGGSGGGALAGTEVALGAALLLLLGRRVRRAGRTAGSP